ncbi:MAG: endonuclease MutS2 [Candidatus Rokuibacteriota bacterium]|nr:MAG: endonuclease MutS2 [Candidatus Rokubacteria bacterium]
MTSGGDRVDNMAAEALSGRGVEWTEVRALLAAETDTPMGRDRALGATPLLDSPAVSAALNETSQARLAVAAHGLPPWQAIPDVRPSLTRCRADGTVLDGVELRRLVPLLEAAPRLRAYGQSIRPVAPALADIGHRLPKLDDLRAALSAALADDGTLTDGASTELRRLRQRIRDLQRRIVRDLDALFQAADADRIFSDRYVTRRNGRYVVPVRAEARARLRGIVHDRSQSGQTVFIEPDRVVEANNDLVDNARQEEQEAARLLAELSEAVRARLPEIERLVADLGELDWIVARARLAERMDATHPVLDPGVVSLRAARHPLLLAQSWRDPARPVVAVDLELGRERPLLVVTGPNAGGKTIALKTLGLLVLMAQVGCHVPAAEGSRLPLISRLVAVIGDEQSVAENLSTFSAFVRQVRDVLEHVDDHSLVLLDELGAGTDPDEGAALAQAILEALERRGALVMATTHLEPLKAFASTHPGARNAAVEFDRERLAPTFRLVYDYPGQSYALAIAARLGLDPTLIERAQAHRSAQAARLGELLSRLDAQTRTEAARLLAIERSEREATDHLARAAAELTRAEGRAREVVTRAKQDAAALLSELRRAAAVEWERLKHAERSRKTLDDVRQRVRDLAARAGSATVEDPVPSGPLAPGDAVEAPHLGVRGQLQAVAGATATVASGTITVRVPVQSLRKIAGGVPAPRPVRIPGKTNVAPELHLLGRTTEEARGIVEKYLDDAFLAGLPAVRLIHGKGTGALRKTVHDLLAGHPLVESFRNGDAREGGAGATVAALRVG